MKKAVLLSVGVAGMALAQAAQAGDWEFTLGLNYRSFDQIEYDNYDLDHPANLGGTAVVDEGLTYTDNGPTIFLGLANVPNPVNFDPGNVNDVTIHRAAVTGRDGDIDAGAGVVLGARKDRRYRDTRYIWGLDLSLATAFADTSNALNAAVTNVNLTGFDVAPADGTWDSNPYIGAKNAAAGQVGADVQAAVNYDLDLGVYTMGAGLSGSYESGAVALRLAGGPSLTLTNFDIRRSETVTYNSGANTIYSTAQDEDGTDFDFGAYLSAGMDFQINPSMGVGLSVRYDWIPSGPESNLADLELSGTSGLLQLLYRF